MLLCVGDLVEDVVVRVLGPVVTGSDTPAEIERRPGGSAANVARVAASLACPARLLAATGGDAAGAALRTELAGRGVEVVGPATGTTATIVVLVDPAGERTFLTDRRACVALTATAEELHRAVDGVQWVHAPAYGLTDEPMRATVLAALAVARASGARLSVDVSSVHVIDRLGGRHPARDVLGDLGADLVLANRQEAAALDLVEHPLPGAASVVKQGPDPSLVWSDGHWVAVPTQRRLVGVDTTGAGDAFAAGLLAALVRGEDLLDAAGMGNDAAAAFLEARVARSRTEELA